MSVDIVGPLPRSKDATTSYCMKYALIAVALVPDLGWWKTTKKMNREMNMKTNHMKNRIVHLWRRVMQNRGSWIS